MSISRKIKSEISVSLFNLIKETHPEALNASRSLLEMGANPFIIYSKDKSSSCAFFEAANKANPSAMKLLAEFWIKPSTEKQLQLVSQAILNAAHQKHWATLLVLKDVLAGHSGLLDAKALGEALLHAAYDASDEAYEIAKLLLSAGAEVNVQADLYYLISTQVRHHATLHRSQCNADRRILLSTPLHLATVKGDQRMITLFLKYNANPFPEDKVKGKDYEYCYPVHAAEKAGGFSTVTFFHKSISQPDLKEDKKSSRRASFR